VCACLHTHGGCRVTRHAAQPRERRVRARGGGSAAARGVQLLRLLLRAHAQQLHRVQPHLQCVCVRAAQRGTEHTRRRHRANVLLCVSKHLEPKLPSAACGLRFPAARAESSRTLPPCMTREEGLAHPCRHLLLKAAGGPHLLMIVVERLVGRTIARRLKREPAPVHAEQRHEALAPHARVCIRHGEALQHRLHRALRQRSPGECVACQRGLFHT
jgi:hypothetical protein